MRTSAGLENNPKIMLAIASSYVVDALLLLGFALAGTISWWIPLGYLSTGLIECAFFYRWNERLELHANAAGVERVVVARMLVASVIQLGFIALAPQVGFYFVTLLFIVYGIGSMSVSARHALWTWVAVTLITSVLLTRAQQADWIPQSTGAERTLVWLCFVAILGRCILLGIFGGQPLNESVETLQQRDPSLEGVNAQLRHQATHDSLTGLANRALFAERMEAAVAKCDPFAVAVLDLDRFKIINDSLGHGAGDALLKLVARRLFSITRADDIVARGGGDEFMLLLRDVASKADIEKLAKRWMDALSEPYRVNGTQLHVSPSIGIACFPADANESEELLARADEAMYHGKQNGRNSCRFFDAEVMGFSHERLSIESELRQAIAASQFQLHYQPKIDIASDEMRGVEALLRWQHPVRGRMMPADFISIAEDSGLILPIGLWVLDEACRQARLWQIQGLAFLRVAVNVSPTQFRQPDFAKSVHAALMRHSLHASYLEIEITEAALMSNAEKSVTVLEQLSRLGVVVAIDDFGTGFSSISYLQRFPIDKLKIDLSFIRHLQTNPNDASIVRAIISLAHGLRLKVAAEGVESAAQLAILKRMGCDQYQGFFRSPAVAAAGIELMLASARSTAANDSPARATVVKLARLVRTKP
jgi:diguanylate cyclase (GGDEF)-like protein